MFVAQSPLFLGSIIIHFGTHFHPGSQPTNLTEFSGRTSWKEHGGNSFLFFELVTWMSSVTASYMILGHEPVGGLRCLHQLRGHGSVVLPLLTSAVRGSIVPFTASICPSLFFSFTSSIYGAEWAGTVTVARPDDVGRGPLPPSLRPSSIHCPPKSLHSPSLSVRIPFMPPRDIRALRHPAAATAEWVERGRLGNLVLPRSLHSSEASQIRQGLPHSVRARDIILRRLSNVEGGVPE